MCDGSPSAAKERELALVYDELNRALGSHAPKAWDRIAEKLAAEQIDPADPWYEIHALIGDGGGHPDEPRTWFQLIVELQGSLDFALDRLMLLAQDAGEEEWSWVLPARVFDGLDGEAVVDALSAAKDAADNIGVALLGATRGR